MSDKIQTVIDDTLDYALIGIIGTMALLVATNVFFRFVLNASIYWGDEVALILMVWLTFLGASVATRENEHYEFKYLINKLEGRALKIYVYLRNSINIIVILILGFYSGRVAIEIHSWIMPATEISRTFVYGACPLGCIFMLYYTLIQFNRDIKHHNRYL